MRNINFRQTIRKATLASTALVLLLLVSVAALPPPSAAADPANCTFIYGSDGKSIEASGAAADCLTGATFTTFKVADAPSGTARYVHQDGKCTQAINIPDNGNPSAGQMSGNTPFSGSNQSCTSFGTVPITVAATPADSTSGTANPQDIVYAQLTALVAKHCNQPDVNVASACTEKYQNWINTCTQSTLANIKSSDKNPNQEFKDQFSACLAKKSKANNGTMTAKEISAALDAEIYNELVNPQDSSNTSGDTCNASGNPITWILCPIYDGFANLSDFLLNSVVQDFLETPPINISSSDPVYKIWSSFRIYGNVFLVIALLVIVFGESIGGGLIDAYTAKKVLPRLLIAAIMINLSIYIVAVLVDVTNIVGQGVGNIITAPLNGVSLSPGGWRLGLFAGASAVSGVAVTGIVAFLAFSGSALAAVVAITQFLPFLFLFIIIPTVLAIALVFITLVFRKAIILALILVSPVAFALYCLPNTEKYFRQWWDLLFRTLMVYPIVMVVFAVSDVLAYTAIVANGNSSFVGYFVAFLLQFLPLLLIPFSFRLAGGVLSRLHDVASGFGKRGVEGLKGNVNDPWSRRNRAKRSASNQFLSGREKLVGTGNKMQINGGRGRRAFGSALSGIAGMGNLQEQRSRRNREGAELHSGHVSTGNDDDSRALFARKLKYNHQIKDKEGNVIGTEERTGWFGTGYKDENGFATDRFGEVASTPQFAGSTVRSARGLYGRDPSLYQPAFTYEMNKAGDDDEKDTIMAVHQSNMADGRLGLDPQREGIWAGTKYHLQNTRREQKHTSENEGGGYVRNSANYGREFNETVDTYTGSKMRESSTRALQDDFETAHTFLQNQAIVESATATEEAKATARGVIAGIAKPATVKGETKPKIRSVAEANEVIKNGVSIASTMDSRRAQYGQYLGEEGEDGPSIQSGAPGKVNEAMDEYVKTVKRLNPDAFPKPQQPRGPQSGPPPTPPGGWGPGGPGANPSGGAGSSSGGGPGVIIPPSGYTGSQG